MNRSATLGALALILVIAGVAGAQTGVWSRLLKALTSGGTVHERASKTEDVAGGVQGALLSAADDAVIESRKQQLAATVMAALKANPKSVYVVEVLVIAGGIGAEAPLDPKLITPLGAGSSVYDAVANSNVVRAASTPNAIDYARSSFQVATLKNGVLDWQSVPMPQPDVLRQKVAEAKVINASTPKGAKSDKRSEGHEPGEHADITGGGSGGSSGGGSTSGGSEGGMTVEHIDRNTGAHGPKESGGGPEHIEGHKPH
jgi:uncharacterized membrane protein YgcG